MSKTPEIKSFDKTEGNKLIANSPFAGSAAEHEIAHHTESGNQIGLEYYYKSLKYHEDWSRLMPVVDKIGQNGYNINLMITGLYSCIIADENGTIIMGEEHESCDTFVETAWTVIVDFIKLYNASDMAKPIS